MKKAVAGIFLNSRPNDRRMGSGETRLVERIEMGKTMAEVLRNNKWKPQLRKEVTDKGYEVMSISVLHGEQNGVDIAVAVRQPTMSMARKKPVTRAGRPVDEIVTDKKTMTAKQRAFRKR